MSERATGDAEAGAEGGDEHRLVRSSAVVGLGTALSRITGFLRVSALAALGFARLTDVYNIANSTPNIVYELLLGGILTATLVPLYVEHFERKDDRATDAINSVALVALAAISVIGFIAAPWIIGLYTLRLHGAGKAAQQALATDLLRWFMPQIFFYGVTALATAMLNARRRFAAAAFAPVLNNVVVIAALLALPRVASEPPTVTSVLQDPALVLLLGPGNHRRHRRHGPRPAARAPPRRASGCTGSGSGATQRCASSRGSPAGRSATSLRTRSRSGSRCSSRTGTSATRPSTWPHSRSSSCRTVCSRCRS